jgi:hypothetical protein
MKRAVPLCTSIEIFTMWITFPFLTSTTATSSSRSFG